jgi:adenylate cyclase
MVPVIQKHNGCVDKFLGDGIMATFGAALPNDTYAADALRAIDAMVAEAEAWNGDLRAAGKAEASINWAVAAGPVVFGAVGDESRLEYTVIGDAANLAAKLEKHNKAEASLALTTAETFSLALAQGYQPPARRDDLEGRRVQGVEEPEDLVVLAALRL